MFGTSVLGCGADLRAIVPDGKCVEYLNNLSQQFNKATRLALRDVADNLKGFSYSFLDTYDSLIDILSDPLKYGEDNLPVSSLSHTNTYICLYTLTHLYIHYSSLFYLYIQFSDLLLLFLGFTETLSVCCGSGKFNAETDCTPTSKYCSDRNKYLFWDRAHPTQALWKTLIRAVTRGRRYASPVTIKRLIHHG